MAKRPTRQHGEAPYSTAWRSALLDSMAKRPTRQHGEAPLAKKQILLYSIASDLVLYFDPLNSHF
jgi:hypothetical protein